MGEAKRKAEFRTAVPSEVRRDIAAIVRSVKWQLPTRAGTCWYTNCAGVMCLEIIGLPAKMEIGSMVYRCGPDPERDVVAFCGPGNMGMIAPDGYFIGHIYVQSDTDLIDFSVGSWREESDKMEGVCVADRRPDGTSPGPAQWTAPPLPDFIWADRATEKAKWRKGGTPELGEWWFGPTNGPLPAITPPILETVEDHFRRQIEVARIRERILFANVN